MAYSKIILNNETLMDVTTDTVDASNLLSGKQATKNDGTKVSGSIASKGSADMTVSGATVTAPAGYYATVASKAIADGSITAPTITIDEETGGITASTRCNSAGYVALNTTRSSSKQLDTQAAKTVTPSETEQTAVTAGKYTTGAVKVAAIPSDYVGSDVTQRDSDDLTASGATITAPAGYYAESASKTVSTTTHPNPTASINSSTGLVTASHTQATGYVTGSTTTGTLQLTTQAAKTVTPSTSSQTAVAAGRYTTGAVTVAAMPSGTAGTPTATKGTVSNNSVSVTPSVTNSTGYITGGTKTGTAVTVSASELVSGTKSITENGTGIDVTNYASVDVNIPNQGKYTATIINNYSGASISTYVKYNNTTYYQNGATFNYNYEDICTLQASGIRAGAVIYIDNVKIKDSGQDDSVSYEYTLPNCDIIIELDVGASTYIKITTLGIKPLSITENGTYTAPTGGGYSPVTVNVSGGGSVSESDVNFIDYDGTILHSYSVSEFMALTAMPENPTHSGLTSQGWNWTLADAKSQLTAYPEGGLTIGQMYVTSSGNTEIDISLDSEHLSPYLTICVNGSVTVDWGDNSVTDTVTGGSLVFLKYTLHEYATAGDYTISISINSGSYAFYNTGTQKGAVLSAYASDSNRRYNREYAGTIKAIRLGTGANIGTYAFNNCYSLQSVMIPNGITSIGSYTFSNCYNLQSVTIPNGVTSILDSTFSNCFLLQSITIPNGIISIGGSAFYNCHSLQSITIPNGITSIGSSAFSSCHALQPITIPDSVTSIGYGAFSSCSIFQSITIPDSVTSIESNTFSSCYSLQSITIPDSVTSIGGSAFYGCYALQSITIPDGVTSIGLQMFYNCYTLQSIMIPDSVTSIGNSAFSNCYNLQSVTIPNGVTSIGTNAFAGCYAIEEYHFLPTTPPTLAGTNAFSNIVTGTIIYVPQGCLEAYQTATNWSTYASYMQEESA